MRHRLGAPATMDARSALGAQRRASARTPTTTTTTTTRRRAARARATPRGPSTARAPCDSDNDGRRTTNHDSREQRDSTCPTDHPVVRRRERSHRARRRAIRPPRLALALASSRARRRESSSRVFPCVRHVRDDDGGVRTDDAGPDRRAAPPDARRGADVVDAASRVDERRAREGAEFARCARVRGERGVDSWGRRCARARRWTRGAWTSRERARESGIDIDVAFVM